MKRLINYPVFFCLLTMFTSMALTNDFDAQVQELIKSDESIVTVEAQQEERETVIALMQ